MNSMVINSVRHLTRRVMMLVALVLTTFVSVIAVAAPASASGGAYEIFYNSNCGGSSRIYDTQGTRTNFAPNLFNIHRNGDYSGFNASVTNNAASVYIRYGNVWIYNGAGYYQYMDDTGTGHCVNLTSGFTKNANVSYLFYSH